ncbi:hypothetical protein [Tenacibaculum agarivorans]|uniref:hypothetical protein n=1 Tax=Tenacibaculum agarivorans TaxID=1908389 RepID=UPI00094BC509|nr:hypothetical protein [Tenacibaculum agarivorans]
MKKILQAILGIFGFKVLTKKEYKALLPAKPIDPAELETLLTYEEVVDMLQNYDETRLKPLIDILGFEDSRITTFDFRELKKYMAFMEHQAEEKGIRLKGISFIKGVYSGKVSKNENFIEYENLFYVPTTMVNNEEVLVDVINSKKGELVTFKRMLAEFGYEWRYDNIKNFKLKANLQIEQLQKVESQVLKSMVMMRESEQLKLSSAGNMGTIAPPLPSK